MTRSRAALPWVIWVVGTLTYFAAIAGRSSIAGVATDVAVRFDVDSTTLALFATLQLAVYTAMQLPAGLLLDRFGARVVLTAGMVVMAGGSLWLAFATDVGTAIAARVLTGAGDAMIFPGVIRLLALWFPARRVPLLQQITAQTGQLGQIFSVIVVAAVARTVSWEAAFGMLAAGLVAFAIVDAVLVRERDVPGARVGGGAASGSARPRQRALISGALREPGTRLGFWIHFTTQFGGSAFALLWGIPYLTQAEGMDPAAAGALFTVMVLAGAVFAPLVGLASGARPDRRAALALASVAAQAAATAAVLLWPGPAPTAMLVVWLVALSTGGAASMIAFDVTRRYNPIVRLSTATGVVNMGGWTAALIVVYLIGLVLDVQGADPAAYTRPELRWAMSTMFLLWIAGSVGILVEARRRRRLDALEA